MITNPNSYPCEFDGYILPETLTEETEETKRQLEKCNINLKDTIAKVKESASKRRATF